jgi:hypothetical protein
MVDLNDDAGLVALGGGVMFSDQPNHLRVVVPQIPVTTCVEYSLADVVDVWTGNPPALWGRCSDSLV